MNTKFDYEHLIENPLLIDYTNLFTQKWKIIQLKKIAKNCKIRVGGKKQELLVRLYDYLSKYKFATKIQSLYRGRLIRRFFNLYNKSNITYKDCVNDTDFMTLDSLKELDVYQFIPVKDDKNFTYGFDICSLYNLFQMQKLPCNPYNREIFNKKILKNMRDIVKLSVILKINININIEDEHLHISRINPSIEQRVEKVFQYMDEVGNYTNTEWFNTLNRENLIKFVMQLFDIWNYRLQLSDQIKREISPPYGNPFSHINFTLFRLQTFERIKKDAIKVMETMIFTGVDCSSNVLGCHYCLSALTLVNSEAASVMPWLYQSVSEHDFF